MNVKEGDRIRITTPRKRFLGAKYRDSKKVFRVKSIYKGKAWIYGSIIDLSMDGFYPDEYKVIPSRRNDIITRIIRRMERLKND